MNDKHTAIYVRVSTKKASQKDSPEHQKGICEEKARELGLKVLYPVYEDKETGTSIMTRKSIQQLIDDAKKDRFRTVLFASLSRFSRDTYDSLGLKRILVDTLGMRLISLDENYDSLVDRDEFKFQIISAVNQKLSEQISLSSKRGIRQSAMKGNYVGSITPYGYQKFQTQSRKTLIPNEDTKEIVQLIYHKYINEKMGEKAIVNFLNEEGVPSYRGGKWGITSIQRILTNPVYTGENVFGKYETKQVYNNVQNMYDRGKKQVQRKEEDWEHCTFKTHEALIDDDTYHKAQEIRMLRGGGKRGGRKSNINVFAGIIFCKHCGNAIVSMKSIGKNAEYRYLICSKRRRQGDQGCDNSNWIPYYDFRDKLLSEVSKRLKRIINIDSVARKVLTQITLEKPANHEKELKKFKKIIDDNRTLLFELRKQRMRHEVDEQQYVFEKELYEEEIKSVHGKMDLLVAQAKLTVNPDFLKKDMKQAIDDLLSLKNYDRIDETKIILKRLIEKITVHHNGEIEIFTPLGSDSLNL